MAYAETKGERKHERLQSKEAGDNGFARVASGEKRGERSDSTMSFSVELGEKGSAHRASNEGWTVVAYAEHKKLSRKEDSLLFPVRGSEMSLDMTSGLRKERNSVTSRRGTHQLPTRGKSLYISV